MMALEPHGPDTYVGIGPRYPWGGLYGGQIVAQGLRAAATTVEAHLHVHSLHAYFIRRGDHEEPIRFEVDRVRNGRSFVTRRVVARQSIGAILTMEASFQVDEDAPAVQAVEPPAVPAPASLAPASWSTQFDRRGITVAEPGRARGWIRFVEPIGDDRLLHACALAYVSDDLPTDPIVTLHPHRPANMDYEHDEWPFMNASLDHAVWFHRQQRAEEWQLHDFTCHGIMGSRGISIGHVFTQSGVHVATIAQEVLMRRMR
jgi:acyl-CoA thioesterase-2